MCSYDLWVPKHHLTCTSWSTPKVKGAVFSFGLYGITATITIHFPPTTLYSFLLAFLPGRACRSIYLER